MIKKSISISISVLFLSIFYGCGGTSEEFSQKWNNVKLITAEISIPLFKEARFNIIDFGAKNDSLFDSRKAIQSAIDECSGSGGGNVIIPAGTYYCGGPLFIRSNTNLHIEENAKVNFSVNPKDYLPVVQSRWEGMECYNYSALLYSKDQVNIAVTGKGILHGKASAENWWSWKGKKQYGWQEGMPSQNDEAGRPRLMRMNNTDVPPEKRIFGEGSYLRPDFLQFLNCSNVLIEDVTFIDSPMWMIHPVLCKNVTIKGVTVRGKGPNNDGCDPESCKNVLIENCFFDTGDDCIAIKSGRNNDGRRINVPSENIIIRDCVMHDGHGGIVMGSEISGGIKNIFAENCYMDSPNLDRAIRIKTNHFRGGLVEDIYLKNITVGEVKEAVVKFNLRYDISKETGQVFLPRLRNVHIKNLTAEKSKYAFFFDGLTDSKISDIFIDSCKISGIEKGNLINNVENFETEEVYINEKLYR